MSKLDLSTLLQQRTRQLGITKSQLAKRSGISRQTLYKLLNAEIVEAKLSTIVKLSEALKLHPIDLLKLYFDGLKLRSYLKKDDSGFLGDVTYPDNSLVTINQQFTKVWNLKNIGKTTWVNRRLICVDDQLQVSNNIDNIDNIKVNVQRGLKPLQTIINIPKTEPGETVQISIDFLAPSYPCSVISYWKSIDEKGEFCFPDKEGLSCHVKVIGL